ncbi:hypothetical protein BSL78_26482, partial [Apostichopus japonicus]
MVMLPKWKGTLDEDSESSDLDQACSSRSTPKRVCPTRQNALLPVDPYEEDCESDIESDTESWENQLKRLHKSFTT